MDEKKPHLKAPREVLETGLMNLVAGAAERASWDSCRLIGSWLGLLTFAAIRGRRESAIRNLRLAFPELSAARAQQMARQSSQNFGMTFCEFSRLRIATAEEIRAYASIEGLEHIEEGLARNKGVLLLTAHLGNWEVMGARAAQEIPLTVVARPASNSGVQKHIEAVRRAAGIEVISKFDTGRASLQALRKNRAVGILPDQHAGSIKKNPSGIMLPMFGHPTRVVTAIARLAILSGAPIVPAFGIRRRPWLRDGRIVAKVSPGLYLEKPSSRDPEAREAAVVEGTKLVIHEIEKIVRLYPEQWLWMHNRWRAEDMESDEGQALYREIENGA